MSLPIINIIGAGRLGKTIGYLLSRNKLGKIQDVYNTSLKSGQDAVTFIGQGNACSHMKEIRPAALYFLCTPDDYIEKSYMQLLEVCNPPKGSAFVHFSGSLASSILKYTGAREHLVASLHPIKSFANPHESVTSFSGTFCAFEGDQPIFDLLQPCFQKMGATVFPIDKEKKSVYHAASVFACNYLVTIAHVASESYKFAGISEKITTELVNRLMNNTLQNISNVSTLSAALTGPLERGDSNTIRKHVDALHSQTPFAILYQELGKATLGITKHSVDKKEELLTAIRGNRPDLTSGSQAQ